MEITDALKEIIVATSINTGVIVFLFSICSFLLSSAFDKIWIHQKAKLKARETEKHGKNS